MGYLHAAAGHKYDTRHRRSPMTHFDLPEEARNPAYKNLPDLTTEKGYAAVMQRAREYGKALAKRPIIANYNVATEQSMLQDGRLCPSESADRDFRRWVQAGHKSLEALSTHWGREVDSWDDVVQIVSADLVKRELEKPERTGTEAIDWNAIAGRRSEWQDKEMAKDPARSMDWLRWRSYWTTKAYTDFCAAFREVNQYTILNSGFCWPNFRPQITMKFYQNVGAVGLDVEYCAGQRPGLGTLQEMIDILEMAESCVETPARSGPCVPMWGHEIYVQPTYADDYAALQTWGLIAHGMTVVGQFAWRPHCDHYPIKEPEAWKKEGAKPMWCIIDVDGTKLPNYFGTVCATRELNEFHKRYDGLSLRRARTKTALFVSPDSAVRSYYTTNGKEWNSPVPRSRTSLTYMLRLEGITVDYLDDETLPQYANYYDVMFVPFSPSLAQEHAKALLEFAEEGGTLVLVGASGIEDPWLKRYDVVGGPAWARLGWRAPQFEIAPETVVRTADAEPQVEYKSFRGVECGNIPGAKVLMVNSKGAPVGWEKQVGKGRVLAIGPYPYTYNKNPHLPAGLRDFAGRFVAWTGLKARDCWTTSIAPTPDASYGTGAPVVDVVRRIKSQDEFFIFVMNTGGRGKGRLEVSVGTGDWRVTDALFQLPVDEARRGGEIIRFLLVLTPWQYRVFHFKRLG